MDEVFDAAWGARFGGRHSAIETELATLVDVHGGSLADQPKQLRLWLTQACPDATDQIAALVAAAEAGVATRLRGTSDDDALPALLARCVGDVQRHGIDEVDWAWWAVRTWAHAFALPTSRRAMAPAAAPAGETRAAFAPWMIDAPAPARTPVPTVQPTPASPRTPPPIVPAAGIVAAPVVPTPVASTPVVPAPAVAVAPPVETAIEMPVHDTVDVPVTMRAPVAPIAPMSSIHVPPVDVLLPEVPVVGVPTIEVPVVSSPVAPLPPDDAPRARGGDVAPPSPRERRPALVAAAIVVPLVLVLFGVWRWSSSSTPTPAPVAVVPSSVPVPAPAAEPPAPSIAASSTVTPAPAPAPAPAPVATPAEATPPLASMPAPQAIEPAPSSPVAAKTPLQAAVVDASQKPATPMPHRPVIARIDVPRIVDGDPFAVLVRLASDPADVARIERHVTPTTGSWPRSGSIAFPAGTRVSEAMAIPFRGIAAPATATVEFVAIGRDGSRSPPGSVRLTVTPAVRVAAGAATAAAPPPPATTAAGCAPTTCGVVTGSRQLETGAGVAIYQITVRNDARDSLSFTVPYRLQSGTRVHVNGGRLVPIGP